MAYWFACAMVAMTATALFLVANQRNQAERAMHAWIQGYSWLEKYGQGPDFLYDRAAALRIVAETLPAKYGPSQVLESAKVYEDLWTRSKAEARRVR